MFNQWPLNYSSISSRANALLKSFIGRLICYRKLSNMGWKGGVSDVTTSSGTVPIPSGFCTMRGVGGEKELKQKCHLTKLPCSVLILHYGTCNSRAIQKKNVFCFELFALQSESRCAQHISVFPHHYLHSCRGEGGGESGKSWLFVWRGELF